MALAALLMLAAATPVVESAAPTQGVIAYPAEFFAASQPNTAMEMVQRLPGFSFDAGDTVRGFSGAGGNVLIDGERPVTKSDNLESVLRRIPASQVERVELIRGGAPGIDMQGKTVLANIVRKKGDSVTGLLAVADTIVYDGRHAPAIRIEGARRGNGRSLEGSILGAGFFDDGAGDGPRTQRDGAGVVDRWDVETEGDGVQWVVTGAYDTPLAGGKMRLNARGMIENFFYDEVAHGLTGPDGLTERDHQSRRDGEAGVSYSRDLGPRAKLDALAIQQIRKTDLMVQLIEPGSNGLFLADRLAGETIGRATLAFRKSGALSIETGAEGAFNWLESKTSFTNNAVIVALPAANVRVEELRGEGFGQGTWKPNAVLTIEGGLRVETSRISSEGDVVLEKTVTFVKPRGVVTWSPNPGNQLRGRIERQVGQLNFDDFVAAVTAGAVGAGNPDLNPEHDWVGEATYERRFWGKGAAVFTVRHFEISDVIDRAPDPSGAFDTPENIGEGTRDELAVSLNLPLDTLGLKGALLRGESTWRRSEVTDPTTGELREISGEHPIDWEAHFSHDLPRWRLNWGVDVYGAWRETYYRFNEIETRKLRTWVVPYAEWKPRPDISWRLEAANATSRDFTRFREIYSGPRDAAPLQFTEAQALDFGTNIYIRVRKTIG